MGFLRGARELHKMGVEARRAHDPVAQARAASQQMQTLNRAIAGATATIAADPADAVDGHVQIVTLGPATAMVGLDPVFELSVVVYPEGLPPAPATVPVVVPAGRVVRVQPGANLPARISRAQPGTFAIRWDEAAPVS